MLIIGLIHASKTSFYKVLTNEAMVNVGEEAIYAAKDSPVYAFYLILRLLEKLVVNQLSLFHLNTHLVMQKMSQVRIKLLEY